MTIDAFDEIWNIANGVTLDRMYRPRAKMSREQAQALLAIVAGHPKGTVRQEFIDEAREVLA